MASTSGKKHTTELADGTRINLEGMWGYCTRCKQIKPVSEIGMRRMKPLVGEIRRQPFCNKDRPHK